MGSAPLTNGFIVTITKEVIPQGRCMQKRLQYGIHKTRITEVVETPQARWKLLIPSQWGRSLQAPARGHPRLVVNPSPSLPGFIAIPFRSRLSVTPITLSPSANDGPIEIQVVHLIATQATEKLRALNVDC